MRINQNSVWVCSKSGVQVFPKFEAKECVGFFDADGNKTETPKKMEVSDLESARRYVKAFADLGVKPRSGYDKYYNDDGFINPESPYNLSSQGVTKLMLVLVNVANSIIAKGGGDAEDMKAGLAAVEAYKSVAAADIEDQRKKKALTEALEIVGPDALKAFAVSQSIPTEPAVTGKNEETVEAES